jgi:hypothetical protein
MLSVQTQRGLACTHGVCSFALQYDQRHSDHVADIHPSSGMRINLEGVWIRHQLRLTH